MPVIICHLSQPLYIVCVQWAYIHSHSAGLGSLKQAVVQRILMLPLNIHDHISFLASDALSSYTHIYYVCVCVMGRDSSVSIAAFYVLDGPGIESW